MILSSPFKADGYYVLTTQTSAGKKKTCPLGYSLDSIVPDSVIPKGRYSSRCTLPAADSFQN